MSSVFDKQMGLKELVEYRNELQKQVDETGETLPDEVHELSLVASQLLAGKIDAAARFQESLEAHLKACKEQMAYLSRMLETTERLMKEAVVASGGTRLDGKSYSMRVQNNSRASTVVDDPTKVPKQFFNVSFTRDFKYDESILLYWSRAILGKMVKFKTDLVEAEMNASIFYRLDITKEEQAKLEKVFKFDPSKTDIEAALKKDPNAVPGAHLDRGTHLRVDPGKAKSKELTSG